MKQRLDLVLVKKGLAQSRRQAQTLIMSGLVFVDGQRRDKAGWPVTEEALITLKETAPYVSRAGLKLASAAQKLHLDFSGKTVLDVGSSTGGFTDFVLQQGGRRVYAVDVGTNQLHFRLRQDPRVVVMEKTDIRDVAVLPAKADIAVMDVSFISVRKILPDLPRLLKPDGRIVVMVKPQFEAGRLLADKHKGVIKNDRIRRDILKDFELWSKQYFLILDKADSEVKGMKGNVERFYLLQPI